MRKLLLSLAVVALGGYLFSPGMAGWHLALAESRPAVRRPADDAGSLEMKRQQLAEKEAALNAKEEALRKLSASLDARVGELNAARKGLEASLAVKKKQDDERYKKMVKIYKGLKPDEAGALLNKLDGKLLIEMLNQMDPKTAVRLIPYIKQPRVLEWTRLNLTGK